MKKALTFLFPAVGGCPLHLGLAVVRIGLGVLFAIHGFQKLSAFAAMADTFPDPLGIGSAASLSLAIFGELVCGVAFTLGFLTRLSVLPMMTTMLVAFFGVHGAGLDNGGELPLVYLLVFVGFFLIGAGRCSVDGWISKRLGTSCSCSLA